MAKGSIAKVNIENTIRNAFGKDFIGVSDKKLYVQADDGNGEMVQIAISMTCPKTPLGIEGLDFENMPTAATAPTEFKPAEITNEETENIKRMLAELGL